MGTPAPGPPPRTAPAPPRPAPCAPGARRGRRTRPRAQLRGCQTSSTGAAYCAVRVRVCACWSGTTLMTVMGPAPLGASPRRQRARARQSGQRATMARHPVTRVPLKDRQPGRLMHALFMKPGYAGDMSTEIIQVRDVPAEDVDVLRARAASRNMSLSSYLRELIHDDTARPAMTDVLARIADRESIEARGEDIRSFINDDGHYLRSSLMNDRMSSPRASMLSRSCLLYTSDAADEEDSVDL